jgi:hypothetical protein
VILYQYLEVQTLVYRLIVIFEDETIKVGGKLPFVWVKPLEENIRRSAFMSCEKIMRGSVVGKSS